MSTAVTTRANGGELMESVVIKGDLSTLSPADRSSYYMAVCKSVGLNPLTQPFAYITLNQKLTLYALRNCTDQLRSIHKVSVIEMTETERDGVCIVTCKVANADGRTDIAKGAVNLGGLKGEALANAIMKAETKAKRRATLSICGLGMLDETEVEDIPRPNPHVTRPEDVTDVPPPDSEYWFPAVDGITPLPKKDAKPISTKLQAEMYATTGVVEAMAWKNDATNRVACLPEDWRKIFSGKFREHVETLMMADREIEEIP